MVSSFLSVTHSVAQVNALDVQQFDCLGRTRFPTRVHERVERQVAISRRTDCRLLTPIEYARQHSAEGRSGLRLDSSSDKLQVPHPGCLIEPERRREDYQAGIELAAKEVCPLPPVAQQMPDRPGRPES